MCYEVVCSSDGSSYEVQVADLSSQPPGLLSIGTCSGEGQTLPLGVRRAVAGLEVDELGRWQRELRGAAGGLLAAELSGRAGRHGHHQQHHAGRYEHDA